MGENLPLTQNTVPSSATSLPFFNRPPHFSNVYMLLSRLSLDCEDWFAVARLVPEEGCVTGVELPPAAFRFLGTLTFGFAENVLVPGIGELPLFPAGALRF